MPIGLNELYQFAALVSKRNGALSMCVMMPRIVCNDGFSFSAQAGSALYSIPRVDRSENGYAAFELGFPSEHEEMLDEYVEWYGYDEPNWTKSVYPYVPLKLIDEMIEKHGGIIGFR